MGLSEPQVPLDLLSVNDPE
jgi:hypothetical protein